ncbi:MAG TPA: transglycosylase domain-containing protein, partial [Acidobacteriota bacterium]|nr:transglycosylase domain-containing protein [Acidobacteriota bacterium]
MLLSISRKPDKVFVGFFAMAFLFFLGVLFLWYCHRTIERHLKTQSWSMPSVLYAQSPVLSAGHPMQPGKLITYLEKLDYHRQTGSDRVLDPGEYAVLPGAIKLKKRQLFLTEEEHSPVRIDFGAHGIRSIAELDSGTVLSSYELEPIPVKSFFGEHWEKRSVVFLKDIPVPLIKAVLATEDRRFFGHRGIDWRAIGRAVWKNVKEKKVLEGGSTITQQLAKNFYLSPERSLRRKISEAIMALMLEEKLSKKEILELYLNEIYLGQRGPIGIHGVGEASRFYFGKDVQHLSLPEGALLAGMIRAPNLYNPYRHPQEAKARRDTVLAAMRDLKMITRSECKQYAAVPLKLASPKIETNVAPYFADVTKAQLNEKYDNETLATNNLRIFTTLDLEMQEHAERILREGLDG